MKLFLINFILIFASSSAFCQKKELLRIAVYDFPPHVTIDAAKTVPNGAAIEFLTETLDIDRHYEIRWLMSPFSRFLAEMESGKADMGLFLAKTPDREQHIRYAERSLFTTDAAVILNKDITFTNLKSLSGKVLGHTLGSVEPDYFKGTNIKFDGISGDEVVKRNLQRLKLKRIDGVYLPTYSNGEFLLKKLGMEDLFNIVKIPNTVLELYFVFRKNIDDRTFAAINDLLNKRRSAYLPLLDKYLNSPKLTAAKTGLR